MTLLEICIAMAIALILTGIGIGAHGVIRRSADRTVCVSNLRQIGQATLAYAQDHGGSLPALHSSLQYAFYNSKSDSNPKTLIDFLRPYLGLPAAKSGELHAEIMQCPGARKVILQQGGNLNRGRFYTQPLQALFGDPKELRYPFGYQYPDDRGTLQPVRLANVVDLPGVRLLQDAIAGSAASRADPGIPWTPAHQRSYNAIFMDGHVETLPSP